MNVIEKESTALLHQASQYLTAAAISYLDKKEDDSHTNFGWDKVSKAFTTRYLNEDGIYLSLNLLKFRIEFCRLNKVLASKSLEGSSHGDMLLWMTEVFRDLRFKNLFQFNLHFELPYGEFEENFVFDAIDKNAMLEEVAIREQAYIALKNLTSENFEVRTWPHHFDTGTLIRMSDNKSIGLGLAIPDAIVDDYYYYVSGLNGQEMISAITFPNLVNGEWIDGLWKGAILKAKDADQKKLNTFFNNTKNCFVNKLT